MPLFRVLHRTIYEYEEPVSRCYNEVRQSPRSTTAQRVLRTEVRANPSPALRRDRLDVFGNRVSYFEIGEPHTRFEISSDSLVERYGDEASEADEADFRAESPFVRILPEVLDYAERNLPRGIPMEQAAPALMHAIHRDFRFDPRATQVGTPLAEFFELKRGVCQDFSHWMVACLRSRSVAARYVSGYLETLAPPGRPKLTGADASHAWVSVHLGGTRWLDLDPTNDMAAGERHLVCSWGRDYGDVTPLKGVFFGSGSSRMKVEVDVLRLEAGPDGILAEEGGRPSSFSAP